MIWLRVRKWQMFTITEDLTLFHYLRSVCDLKHICCHCSSRLHTELNQFRTRSRGTEGLFSSSWETCTACHYEVVTGCDRQGSESTNGLLWKAVWCDVCDLGNKLGVWCSVPVGEDFAVVVHLNLEHLVSIQPAGNGPSKCLKEMEH